MPVYQQVSAVTWSLLVGTGIIVVIWAVIRGGWVGRPSADDSTTVSDITPEPILPSSHEHLARITMAKGAVPLIHDFPEGISEAHNPVPLIIKIVMISCLLWAVVYVILFVQSGFNFS